jgi:hypothetical protein
MTTSHLVATLEYAADIRCLNEICLGRLNDGTDPRNPQTTQSPLNTRWLQPLHQLHITIHSGGASSLANFLQLLQDRTEGYANGVL